MSASEESQLDPHTTTFGDMSPSEAGKLGSVERERRWMERRNEVRTVLFADGIDAASNLGRIVRGEAKPNTVQASTAILDRIGIGPKSEIDVNVEGSSHLAAIILRLDAANPTSYVAPEGVALHVPDPELEAVDVASEHPATPLHTPQSSTLHIKGDVQ